MTMYSMPALTNSQVFIKGSQGQTVWAINDTGKESLKKGDKVWLNTILQDKVTESRLWHNNRNIIASGFFKDNIYYSATSKKLWNGSSWSNVPFTTSNSLFNSNWDGFRIENNLAIQMGKGVLLNEYDEPIVLNQDGVILNEKYVAVIDDTWKIKEYNIKTGEVSSTIIYDSGSPSTYVNPIGFFNKNKYALSRPANKTIMISEDLTASTVQYKTYQLPEAFYATWYTNENNPGSYVIGYINGNTGAGYSFKGMNNKTWKIYKFNDDDTLTAAIDLPESLKKWMNLKECNLTYNNQDGILTAIKTTANDYGAWRLVDGVFVELSLPAINVSSSRADHQCLLVSSDLKEIVIAKPYDTSSYTYQDIFIYRYDIIDGKWYASNQYWKDDNTLTGFATGEINEEGLYEISTVLPEKVS